MRIACLVTVCAVLTYTLSTVTASPQKRYQVKEVSVEPRNFNLTDDPSQQPDDFIFLRETTTRKPRKEHHTTQVFPIRRHSPRGSISERPRRQTRKLSTRSLSISRSLDVTQHQNALESIQSPETFEDGAIHIEPLYRVSKKKGIWDSLVDIFRRVIDPPKTHLGPLIGPIHVPGLGDKVFIRLLEPPESNHLVIKVVSHVPSPHEIEALPHVSSGVTIVKSPEPISIDHHTSILSTDILSGSSDHLSNAHPTSLGVSSDSLSVVSNHHPVHSASPISADVLTSSSNQYRQVQHPSSIPSADNLASSSNQYQQVHRPPSSTHADKQPKSSNQYRHARPTVLPSSGVHTPSNNVMKIPKSVPTTYKPSKDAARTSRMYKMKQKLSDPKPTVQTISSTSISPTNAASVQKTVRIEANRQSPIPTRATNFSPSTPYGSSNQENREPFFHSVQFEETAFKPLHGERYQFRPTPAVEIHEFGNNDVLVPKTTEATIALNPLFADNPSSTVARVSRVVQESTTPRSYIANAGPFEMVRAPTLIPTYPPFIPHPPFILPHETIDTSPTKFNLFSTMQSPLLQPWSEKPAKIKEIKPVASVLNQPLKTFSPVFSNSSWESVKTKYADQIGAKTRKVLTEVSPTSNNVKAIETSVSLTSVAPAVKSPTASPLKNPVNKATTIVPVTRAVNKSPIVLPVNSNPVKASTIAPVNGIASGGPISIPTVANVISKASAIIPLSDVPSVAAKSAGKDEPKCLNCQESKEKKVVVITDRPHPVDSILQENVPLATARNTTPATKVSSPSSSSGKSVKLLASSTIKPVAVSSTTKKSSGISPVKRLISNSSPQKLIANSSLKKKVITNTTKRPFIINTTKKLSLINNNSSSTTTKKPPIPATDFKKRLEMWKKNQKV